MYKSLQSSIRSCEKLAEVSDWAARVWKHGLAQSDFFGRMTASVKKFRADAMPLFQKRTDDEFAAAIAELGKSNLVHLYEVGGRPYMVFHDHEEHNATIRNLRNIRPQYPAPPKLCLCIEYADFEKQTLSAFLDEAEAALRPLRTREVDGDPHEAVVVHLLKLAIGAKCPSNEATMRKHIDGLTAREDVGAQKLEEYLMSPSARGKTVNDWQDHFRPKGNGRPPIKSEI